MAVSGIIELVATRCNGLAKQSYQRISLLAKGSASFVVTCLLSSLINLRTITQIRAGRLLFHRILRRSRRRLARRDGWCAGWLSARDAFLIEISQDFLTNGLCSFQLRI